MNPSDLAREVNLPTPTVHRIVSGKSTRPYRSSLEPIANYFSLRVEQLLGEESLPVRIDKESALATENKIKIIPVISWEEVHSLNEAKTNSTKKIAAIGNMSNDCFSLLMNDHSMEPLFPVKTILIFDPDRKPIDRSYILVKLENIKIPVFRQLLIDADYKYLKPLNPDLNTYKMRLLTEKDSIIACLQESRINHNLEDTNNKEVLSL